MGVVIIKKSCMAIGAETGLAHIACAFNVPNVVLLGGGHYGRFRGTAGAAPPRPEALPGQAAGGASRGAGYPEPRRAR